MREFFGKLVNNITNWGWIVLNLPTIISYAREVIMAVQAIGNYLRSSDAEKKEVAVRSLSRIIREFFPTLPASVDAHLELMVGVVIEAVLKTVRRQHADTWKPAEATPAISMLGTSSLPMQPKASDARKIIESQRSPYSYIPASLEYLEVAVGEFEKLEHEINLHRNSARA